MFCHEFLVGFSECLNDGAKQACVWCCFGHNFPSFNYQVSRQVDVVLGIIYGYSEGNGGL